MASVEVSGRIVKFMPKVEGESARGTWAKQEVIIESQGQVPKKLAVTIWQDKMQEFEKYREGDVIKLGVNLESREYNGKWYTDIRVWRVIDGNNAPAGGESEYNQDDNVTPPPAYKKYTPDNSQPNTNAQDMDDDLPF
ncbi:MAG: DUF3127 domain-containing protein [Bacteroidota bacterium]|nr:DUF3127 domain-containing protein [Bacteroidota bacterium]